jgi:hypothetical protein
MLEEIEIQVKVKCMAIPLTGCGGLHDCVHFLDNQLTDGSVKYSVCKKMK